MFTRESGDEPFVVTVRRSLLDNIFADPLQWQELARSSVRRRRCTAHGDDRPEVRSTRNEKKEWQGSQPANVVNIQSLLNTLTVLRAVRWTGATTPAHGFDKPQVTITFTTSPDDKSMHKLVVGASTRTGMWFARTEEREGTFVLSNPDLNALKLPLVAMPSRAHSKCERNGERVTTVSARQNLGGDGLPSGRAERLCAAPRHETCCRLQCHRFCPAL